jgi:hypothetical protein
LSVASTTIACGGTAPDYCSPYYNQAFTSVMPDNIWDLPTMQKATSTLTLPSVAHVGDAYVGPIEIALQGLTLSSPSETWPASYTDSSITWTDEDGDHQNGVTSYMVTGSTSTVCKQPYANLPIAPTGPRATRVYNGSRTEAYLDGKVIDCNTITGKLHGPGGSTTQPLVEGHVAGCLKDNNQPCTAAETDSLDSGGGTSGGQRTTDTRFALIRITDGAKCADVRNVAFPK